MTESLTGVVPGILQDRSPSPFHEGCPNHTAFHNWERQIQTVSTCSQLASSVHTEKYPANLCEEDEKASFLCWWEGIRVDSSQVFRNVRRALRILHCQRAAEDTTWLSLDAGFSYKPWLTAAHHCRVLERLLESCSARSRFRSAALRLHRMGKVWGVNTDKCTVLDMNNIWFKMSKYLKINPPRSCFHSILE